METHLTIVVPAYEEAARGRSGVLNSLVASLREKTFVWELIVVDDGSSDGTPELVEQLVRRNPRVKLLRAPHCGKGYAVLAGMEEARGARILYTDFDQATPLSEVDRLLPWFDQGFDIVVGTRGTGRPQAPLARKCISLGCMLLRRVLLGPDPIVDTQCGFKAFTRESLKSIIPGLHLYHPDNRRPIRGRRVTPGFDVELLMVGRQLGYAIRQVPVAWSYRHCSGMNLSAAVWQGLADLVRIRLARSRGKYNFAPERLPVPARSASQQKPCDCKAARDQRQDQAGR
ncbi:MAG TPA: glycosyl transferase [Desulfobulbaceae bacterium]|nr:glycosyl transferase [Desulfobulbaceae bacterium]